MSFSRSKPVVAPAATLACRVIFDSPAAAVRPYEGSVALRVALPVLAGREAEHVLDADTVTTDPLNPACTLFRSEGRTAGFIVAPADAELEVAARDLYRRVFAATAGLKLYRIWNYVPQINAYTAGLENYRRFCRGRSHAFEDHFGHSFQRRLPSASAVGALHGPLAVAFLAGQAEPQHFENPRQVPAFEYPPTYGPRPPSFSRATLVVTETGRELFISGTAAIRGHATIAARDLPGQLACTRENLNIIAATAGAGADFGAADRWHRTLKVYVRHASDLEPVRSDLESHLVRAGDAVTYLQADLCREDLLVEVEAVLTREL